MFVRDELLMPGVVAPGSSTFKRCFQQGKEVSKPLKVLNTLASELHTVWVKGGHSHDHYPDALAATSAVESHRVQDGPETVSR
jgi:hypothetical protein